MVWEGATGLASETLFWSSAGLGALKSGQVTLELLRAARALPGESNLLVKLGRLLKEKTSYGDSNFSNRQVPTGKSLFEEFGVQPGNALNLNTPSGPEGRSFITYIFRNAKGEVVYVGRASGTGTPREVLAGRIAKGHAHFGPGLKAEVIDVHGSKLASQGAEEFYIQGFREQGAPLTNIDEALSLDRTSRFQRSLDKLDAFFEELFKRQRGR